MDEKKMIPVKYFSDIPIGAKFFTPRSEAIWIKIDDHSYSDVSSTLVWSSNPNAEMPSGYYYESLKPRKAIKWE